MKIFCILGKSASGKDTIYASLISISKELSPVVTYTTRPRRKGEINGREYHFISMHEMDMMEKNGELIERRNYDTVKEKTSSMMANLGLTF